MEAVLTLYSVYIEEFPLLFEEKHCKMRLSLKGEKKEKKKKACLCSFFFHYKKEKSLKQAQSGDTSGHLNHVVEILPPALATWLQLQTPLGNLGTTLSIDKKPFLPYTAHA